MRSALLTLRALGVLAALGPVARAASAQGGPSSVVSIQPTAQIQGAQTLSVSIYWCDKNFPLTGSTRSIIFKGQNVTAQFTYTSYSFGIHDCAQFFSGTPVHGAKAVGSVTLTGGETTDTLQTSIYNANGTLLSATRTWKLGNSYVQVTPHGGTATPPKNTVGLTQPFAVKNYGNASATYALQVVTCSGSAITLCSAPSSVTVAAGAQATVNVSYTTRDSAYKQGTIELKASYGQYSDVGTVYATVTPTSVANTRVLVNEVNPGTAIDRASCLVFSIGPDLASECGALRVTHALPSVRTLNKTRLPTLVHYGDQVRGPVLATHVILADTATIPTSVQLNVLQVHPGGSTTLLQSRTYAGTAWTSSRGQRLAVADFVSGPTRIVKYQVEVKLLYGGNWQLAAPIVTGELAVVDRLDSRFGAGWWLAGVEQLYPGQPDGAILWVAGDGSTRKYVQTGTLGTDVVHVAETIDRPDTLFRNAQGVYRRSLPSGVRVYFRGSGPQTGLHDSTVNRLGHTTRFVWGDVTGEPRLDSLVVPAPTGVKRFYHFRYDAGGRLYSVLGPGNPPSQPREVLLARKLVNGVPGRGVERITDPDNKSVTFAFQFWGTDYAYGARIDRRGTPTDVVNEASAPTLAYASTPTGAGETVRHDFRTVTGIGAPPAAGPVPVDSIYFRHNGPRTDVADITKVWTDRFGSPTRLVNALGQAVTVRRDDWRFPGSVTRVEYPLLADGRQRVQTATFDSRGNVKAASEVNPYGITGNNRDAVTRYEYDNTTWPTFVTRIVPPERDSVVISYDADGNRAWQRDARGDSTKVFFSYGNSWKLVSSILAGGVKDSLEYNTTLGNLYRSRTPLGEVTTFGEDAVGRNTLVEVPLDGPASPTAFRRQQTYYDVMDQVWRATTTADSFSNVGAQTVTVDNTYDNEGNLKSVTRWSTPDIPLIPNKRTAIGTITTRWDYDSLHRKTREYAPDATPTNPNDNPFDETRYDLAGNVATVITRRRDTLTMSYDALNRLTVRTVPRVMYGSRTGVIQNPPDPFFTSAPPEVTNEKNTPYPRYPNDPVNNATGYTVARDSALLGYDELGNVTRADNRDALVRRGFFLNGLIRGDTLKVRTIAELDAGGDINSTHVYALEHKYDLNGRRTELKHPSQLAPSTGQNTTKYAYTSAGQLLAVTDPLGYSYGYHYNKLGQQIRGTLANRPSFAATSRYDADGHLTGDTIVDGGLAYRKAVFTYDPGGKIRKSMNWSGTKDTTWAKYSGLGHVTEGSILSYVPSSGEWSAEGRYYSSDALGNVYHVRHTTQYNAFDQPHVWGGQGDQERGYESGTGRLAWVEPMPIPDRRDTTHYDLSGNVSFETTLTPYGQPGSIKDRAYYYGADAKLRASDSRSYGYNGLLHATFEEYRYDALGRRVLVRTRRYCYRDDSFGPECNLDWVRRTVWDGTAELYEIQMPLDATYVENDVNTVALAVEVSADGRKFDPNPTFGRVLYAHAAGVDRPQSIIRMGYVSRMDTVQTIVTSPVTFAPFAITPLWDARGQAELLMYPDSGWGKRCQLAVGRTHCVYLLPLNKYLAYERAQGRQEYWHGTVLQDKRDGAGIHYRRNRYYDPSTGRFTQEDPIGLAGGLNVYGFANGDPVNFSDPFGLAPCPPDNDCVDPALLPLGVGEMVILARAVGQAVGAAGDFVRNYRQMREVNTIGADKYFHCKANCEAARRGNVGKGVSEILSDVREGADQLQGDHPDSSAADQEANKAGREGGRGLCKDVCRVYRPKGLDERKY